MFVDRHRPPYKTAGAVFLVVLAVIAALIYLQFRGHFARRTQLTLHSSRAGLVVDPGSKVTYNGVEIGRVARIGMIDADGTPKAELTLEVEPRYLDSSRPTCRPTSRPRRCSATSTCRSARRKTPPRNGFRPAV